MVTRFAVFLGSEPVECRKAWFELDRIAQRCGVSLDELITRIRDHEGEGVYGRAAGLCRELNDAGSLERLYALNDDRGLN